MAKKETRHLRMGCGEALCGALARQQALRPASQPARATGAKSDATPRKRGRSR